MRRFIGTAAALIAVLSALSSCTVKEDRFPCPAYIHPMASEIPSEGDILVTVKAGGGMIYQSLMSREDFLNPDFWVKVPRGNVTVGVTTGVRNMILKSDDVLSTDRVTEADRLYSYVEEFWVDKEEQDVCGTPEKQHSMVYFDILGGVPGSTLSIGGDWAAMNAFTMEAVMGPYAVDITDDLQPDTRYAFCMARQGDFSMKLYIKEPSGRKREIAIGELMEKAGYLKDQDVLADVYITVDLSQAIVSIRIGDWGEVVNFNVVII